MPINLISKIKPKNDGYFPVCEDVDIEGGYQVRANIADRNRIPTLNRKIGMLVYVQSEAKYYTLSGGTGNEHWIEAQIGGGGFTPGGDLSGTSTNQIVIGLNTVPIPQALPIDSDILEVNKPLLLSKQAFGSTTDGYSVWVADIFNPYDGDVNPYHYSNYGGLVKVNYADEYISTRYDYSEQLITGSNSKRIYTVAYFDGYLYASGTEKNNNEWHSAIWKINPANGYILDSSFTDKLSYIYSAAGSLWLTVPGGYSSYEDSSPLYKVDPTNLSIQTLVDLSEYIEGQYTYYCGFTYDSTLEKIWFSSSDTGYIFRIDPTTLNIDIAISDYNFPNGMAYDPDNHKIWVTCSAVGYYATNNSNWIHILNPISGSLITTVSDTTELIHNNLLISYDSTNHKMWCPSSSIPDKLDPPGKISGNRIIRIDATTYTIDGIGQLNSSINNSLICAGGYVWNIDNPEDTVEYSIVKIAPSQITDITDPDNSPFYTGQDWGGILASIDSGRISYTFVQKNSSVVTDCTARELILIRNKDEIVLAPINSDIYLPLTPVDGQKHTIIDANGGAGQPYSSIYVYKQIPYHYPFRSLLYKIYDNYGALTVIWSEAMSRWYIISYYPISSTGPTGPTGDTGPTGPRGDK